MPNECADAAISIHSLHTERDEYYERNKPVQTISIHSLHTERDAVLRV